MITRIVSRRCRFIIEENQRVLDLAAALETGDTAALQDLFAASYKGARDLFEIGAPASCSPESGRNTIHIFQKGYSYGV